MGYHGDYQTSGEYLLAERVNAARLYALKLETEEWEHEATRKRRAASRRVHADAEIDMIDRRLNRVRAWLGASRSSRSRSSAQRSGYVPDHSRGTFVPANRAVNLVPYSHKMVILDR